MEQVKMDEFETPLFRDLAKLYRPILIIFIVAMASFLIITEVFPMIHQHLDFIENNNCIYFEEINETLCGQEAIDFIWKGEQ